MVRFHKIVFSLVLGVCTLSALAEREQFTREWTSCAGYDVTAHIRGERGDVICEIDSEAFNDGSLTHDRFLGTQWRVWDCPPGTTICRRRVHPSSSDHPVYCSYYITFKANDHTVKCFNISLQVFCEAPSSPVNGSISDYPNHAVDGRVTNFKCNQGFSPSKNKNATCVTDQSSGSGAWVPDPAELQCTASGFEKPSLVPVATLSAFLAGAVLCGVCLCGAFIRRTYWNTAEEIRKDCERKLNIKEQEHKQKIETLQDELARTKKELQEFKARDQLFIAESLTANKEHNDEPSSHFPSLEENPHLSSDHSICHILNNKSPTSDSYGRESSTLVTMSQNIGKLLRQPSASATHRSEVDGQSYGDGDAVKDGLRDVAAQVTVAQSGPQLQTTPVHGVPPPHMCSVATDSPETLHGPTISEVDYQENKTRNVQ